MNKAKKEELLNYAIERINQYDDVELEKPFLYELFDIPTCRACEFADDNCELCPFNNMGEYYDSPCRPIEYDCILYTIRTHRDKLIKSVKKWCKEYYPEYTIVKVRSKK